MNIVPESHRDMLTDEARAFAYLATLMPDGSPQLTPLWFDVEGDYIVINSATGRVKDKNMRARSQVAILITDPKDPFYRYLQIRGRVVEETEEGAYYMICRLNEKYHGKREFPKRAGEVRVTYKILPEKMVAGS